MSETTRNRRAAALYGAIIGVTLCACIWLAVACDIRRLWPEAQQEPVA